MKYGPDNLPAFAKPKAKPDPRPNVNEPVKRPFVPKTPPLIIPQMMGPILALPAPASCCRVHEVRKEAADAIRSGAKSMHVKASEWIIVKGWITPGRANVRPGDLPFDQGFAKDIEGRWCRCESAMATCFTMEGAVYRSYGGYNPNHPLFWKASMALDRLRGKLGEPCLSNWERNAYRTKHEVIDALVSIGE